MLNKLIDFSLRHRVLVILIALALAVIGGAALTHLNIDAFPDTTPVQVQINTTAPALNPKEVEQQITFPIEQVIGGLPGLKELRSVSKFGLSQVVVIFEDGVDIYFARQLLTERLNAVELPPGIERPRLGPVATGLGEVYHYILTYKGYDFTKLSEEDRVKKLTELRTIHDWVIKPQLRTVRGVAEVNTWGGLEKQYDVRVSPDKLIQHGLTFTDVAEAIEKNNRNVGGGYLVQNTQAPLIHGIGRTVNLEQLRQIVVTAKGGVPIYLKDVADVEIGHVLRRGAVTADGKGEAVLGLGFLLMGENSHVVTRALKAKIAEIKKTLPPGVVIEEVYDRTELVDHVIDTARRNLFEGGLLVIAVLFLFLGNFRAACIVAVAIPLSMLFAFSGMLRFGIAASLLSLGAIDFGMVVDSSVVMVENCVRHLAHGGVRSRSKLDLIREAAVEVRKPTLFGELIIMIVYLPILTLEGIGGKLFRPMALTVIFALLGSMLFSMTLMPVLASFCLPRRVQEREPLLMRLAHRIHNPILRLCMQHKVVVIGIAVGLMVVSFVLIAPRLLREAVFVPRLSEGAIAINVVRLAGTDLDESVRRNIAMERILLKEFPDEVRHTWSRIGTAEVATDPMGVELTDLFVSLRPRQQWTKARTQEELAKKMEEKLRVIPGQKLSFSQPIEMRINEMVAGVRADVGIKLFGDDLDVLVKKAADIERVLKSISGAADVNVEQVTGQPVLEITMKQQELAQHGVPAKVVLDLVQAQGAVPAGEVQEGQLRFPLVLCLPERYRANKEAIEAIQVPTAAGKRLPVARLATVKVTTGPSTITRENYQRRILISCNVRERGLVGFVNEVRQKIAAQVPLSGRYRVEIGGQFEHYESARQRLLVVGIVVLVLVFGLLLLTYRNVVDALRVLTGIPLGCVGGIIALWLRDIPFSISAAIGFIAMSGVAVLDDMILVSYIRKLRSKGLERDEAVRVAAVTRLRPVLMTTLVASLGFLPMALSTGVGAEVQRPLATVVIGGVISAMLMSLLVIRVLYVVFDSAAGALVWLLRRWFGLQPQQLVWLVGDYREEDVVEGASRDGPARPTADVPETVSV
jgi:cobalt-zinc-cadmium resistance protein CzcA